MRRRSAWFPRLLVCDEFAALSLFSFGSRGCFSVLYGFKVRFFLSGFDIKSDSVADSVLFGLSVILLCCLCASGLVALTLARLRGIPRQIRQLPNPNTRHWIFYPSWARFSIEYDLTFLTTSDLASTRALSEWICNAVHLSAD
jgi:hypothetical protein